MDKVIIKDIQCHGILGINPEERTTPQTIIVNVCMTTHTAKAAVTQDIADAVNYYDVAARVKQFVEDAQVLLVETLVNDLAKMILDENPKVGCVTVKVEKPEAVEFAASVGVEVVRKRN